MTYLPDGIDEDVKITLDNIDDFSVEFLVRHYGIQVRAFGAERGPENTEYAAWVENGPHVTASWPEEAVVDLVILIEGLDK